MYVQRIKAKEPVDESWKKQIVHSVNNYLKAHNPGIEIVDLDEDRLNKWEYTNKFSKSQIKATTAKILALPAAGPSAPLTPTTAEYTSLPAPTTMSVPPAREPGAASHATLHTTASPMS